MSKGSNRRPRQISATEEAERWERSFPKPKPMPQGQQKWAHTQHNFTCIAATERERYVSNYERIFKETDE